MSLLDSIRSRLRSLVGTEPEPDESDDPTADEEPASTEPRLDPGGVTEVRKRSDDDPLDRLREVKRRRAERASDEDDRAGESE